MCKLDYLGDATIFVHRPRPTILKAIAFTAMPLLLACGGGGSGSTLDSTSPTAAQSGIAVTGGGVKGPLAFAKVDLYLLNTNLINFYNPNQPIAAAKTDAFASIQDLTVARGYSSPLVMVVDGANAIDVNTGRSPTLNKLITVITPDMLSGGKPLYATPLTTMAFYMARHSVPAGATDSAFVAALMHAAAKIKNSLGITLPAVLDIFRDPPVINDLTTTPESHLSVVAHRTALEAVAAVLYQMYPDGDVAEPNTRNNLLATLAVDLQSDDVIDGAEKGTPLKGLDTAVLSADPNTLPIPYTSLQLSEVGKLVNADLNFLATSVRVDTSLVTIKLSGKIFVELGTSIGQAGTSPIRLRWDYDPNSSGYLIFTGSTPETATEQIADVPSFDPNAPSFDIDPSTLLASTPDTQICFRIKAYNIFGSSEFSEPACTVL